MAAKIFDLTGRRIYVPRGRRAAIFDRMVRPLVMSAVAIISRARAIKARTNFAIAIGQEWLLGDVAKES